MVASVSFASGGREETRVHGRKRKLEEMSTEKNELKTKFCKLGGDLLSKSAQMKDMTMHVESLEEQSREPAAENDSLQVTKREIITLPMNRSHPKR